MKKLSLIAFILLIPAMAFGYMSGSNFSYGTIAADFAQGAGTFSVTNGQYSQAWPSANFTVTIFDATCSQPSSCANREIILITSRSGSVFTVNSRNYDGTSFSGTWSAGAKVWGTISEARFTDITGTITASVTGPATATDNAIARFNNSPTVVQNSVATVDDNGTVNIPENQTYNVNGTPHMQGLAYGGTNADLSDPDADTLVGWDNTDNAIKYITIGSGLTYTAATDTLSVDAGVGSGDVVSEESSVTDNQIPRFYGTGGKNIDKSLVTIDDTGSINIPSGQLYEIDGAAHGHVGSEVSFTATGTIAATDVQTAIAEVATDAAVGDSITSGNISLEVMPACTQYDMYVAGADGQPDCSDAIPLLSIPEAVYFTGTTDPLKKFVFELDTYITSGNTRILTIQDKNYTVGEHGYVPAEASPTTSAAGQIAIRTGAGAASGVQIYGNAAPGSSFLPVYMTKCTTIVAAAAASDYPVEQFPYAVTIRSARVTQRGATNVIGNFDECDSAGASCAGIDGATDITATTTQTDDGSLSNPSIDANDVIQWHTTSVSGTNTDLIVCIYYTVD